MSDVWKYFNKIPKLKLVSCIICKSKLKYSTGTSCMWNHLKRKHALTSKEVTVPVTEKTTTSTSTRAASISPELSCTSSIRSEVEDVQIELSDDGESVESSSARHRSQSKISEIFFTSSTTARRQNTITDAIARMIAEDMLPISFAEGNGFRQFINTISPTYKVPSKNTIKARINALFDIEKQQLFKTIQDFKCVSLTTDCWTSRNTDSYMTVTLHAIAMDWKQVSFTLCSEYLEERHTGENLSIKLQQIIEDWALQDKVQAIVHDNAANIISAVRMVPEIEDNLCCFAHTLQLSINKGLKEDSIQKLISKCSAIVGHFKHSTVATNAFKAAQETHGIPAHRLIQCVKTRWNSVYYMIERLIEQRQALVSIMQDRSVTSRPQAIALELVEKDWTLLENLEKVLKPFALITKVISSETYPTVSMILPIVISLVDNFLNAEPNDLKEIKSFKVDTSTDLRSRYKYNKSLTGATVEIGLLDISTFLDPRYKSTERHTGLILRVKRTVESLMETVSTTIRTPGIIEEEASTALDLLFPSANNTVETEIDLYFKEPQINKTMCPLAWWKNNENRFPNVAAIAKRYLSVPGTSTPSERVFSAAGNIVTAKRNCLKGKTVNALVFLHNNLKTKNLNKI